MMRLLFTLQYLGTRYAGWQTQTTGVPARARHPHADVPFEIPPRGLVLGLNDLLPHDIRVAAVERVADDFHCRFAATAQTYRYQIWNAPVADAFAQETPAPAPARLRA